ncbi:uncharacterized protein EAF02_009353 [Botrytis sinoallii]|uniref:uncharacterized protein n=1 Tax=Botrytis sinoallii TaxID=1463999 RepID=UPI0019018D7D|nr:uncharacterized protein EAF02_009353 [Botrytis sinoallii]KAF7870163.1 hypothetical protein EAF02_009353 [Botrytis sinoallii]
MANNRYQYKPLTEHDSIRLLVLSPSADSTADIHCDLLTTTLSKVHRDVFSGYTALSYVWGDLEENKVIYIDKEIIGITANLDSALRDIRDPLRKQHLWIDAICINQANSPEKNKQVIQMAKVYQIARKTIIYLGESTEASTLLLGAISRGYKRRPGHVNATEIDMLALLFNGITTYTRENYGKAITLFLEILERPWFARVWVFQELLFSADPWVQCGRHSRSESYRVFVEMDEERRNFKSARRPSNTLAENLIKILTTRRGLGVSDPRDMVFAHKGIVQASSYQDDREAEDIAIDYSKSVEKVFTDLACHCLKTFPEGRRLEILSYKENCNDSLGLPSWVPNWTLKGFPHPYRRLREMGHIRGSTAFQIRPEVEVNVSPPLCAWLNTSFVCSGWRAGSITKISHAITLVQAGWKLPKEHHLDQLRRGWPRERVWIQALTRLYRHWCGLIVPLYSDANAMKLSSENSAPRGPQPLINMFITQSQRSRKEKIDKIARTLSPHNIFPKMNEDFFYNNWGVASLFASTISLIMWAHAINFEDGIAEMALSEVLYDRRFATLEDGTLVLVPVTAMTGDVVCWLRPDLTTSFVLREKAEPPAVSENTIKDLDRPSLGDSEPEYCKYTFVGECHIDTPIYSTVQKSTLSPPPKPCSTQDDYFGKNPGFSNNHGLETFLIS